MKSTTLFLQLTAGLFLLALLALIVGSRFLADEGRSGVAANGTPNGPAALAPDRKDRLQRARLDGCLLVLAPLYRLENRNAFEERWLDRVFGRDMAADSTFLFLHLWQEGGDRPFRLDPGRDRVELELADGTRVRNLPLEDRLHGPALAASDRLYLRTILPPVPLELGPNGMARVLLAFPAREAWSRIKTARLLRGEESIEFAPLEISFAEWEILLSGGPFPRALREAGSDPGR